MEYVVIIHKDKSSDYGVTVPDLPGCFSAGETFEQALENTKEAILTHIEGLLLDDETIPGPSSIEELKEKHNEPAVLWAIVEVTTHDLSEEKKRVNITIPKRLLTKVDRYTEKTGTSRSDFLAEAALEYMSRHIDMKNEGKPRTPGKLKGQISMNADFYENSEGIQ